MGQSVPAYEYTFCLISHETAVVPLFLFLRDGLLADILFVGHCSGILYGDFGSAASGAIGVLLAVLHAVLHYLIVGV